MADNDDIINNPHDRLFRDTFAHRESLVSFVRAYAPPGIVALVNDSTSIEPYPGTFVDPELTLRPPILPLVLYHGDRNWNTARRFQDLIDSPPALAPHTPAFEYVLVDLNEPGMQDRVDDLRCRFVLHLMQAAATDTLLQTLQQHGQLLTALWQALTRGDSLRFLETVIRYAVSVADVDAKRDCHPELRAAQARGIYAHEV